MSSLEGIRVGPGVQVPAGPSEARPSGDVQAPGSARDGAVAEARHAVGPGIDNLERLREPGAGPALAGRRAEAIAPGDSLRDSLVDPQRAKAYLSSLHIDARGVSSEDAPALARRMHDAKAQLQGFGNCWEAARSALAGTPGAMDGLLDFRKRVVDGLIGELRAEFPITASSVGSTAATSDYDVTFASPGSTDDIEAMRRFNEAIARDFGKQPGYAFDTNIYVQDYVRVSETVDRGLRDIDNTPFQPRRVLEASVDVDQHVMSLMKMRRTMDASQWSAFKEAALAPHRNPGGLTGDGVKLEQQYSEADALYVLCNARVVERVERLRGAPIEVHEHDLGNADAQKLRAQPGAQDLAREQMLLDRKVAKAAAESPNLLLQARNEIYADVAREMRNLDIELRQAGQPGAVEGAGDAPAMHAQRMRLTGQAIFFASEAYHSAGAVRHVVSGMQSGAAARLSLNDLQTSFLEQAGDARMHTHARAAPEMAVAASKYMTRMLDALHKFQSGEFEAPPRREGSRMDPARAARNAAAAAFEALVPPNAHRGDTNAAEVGLLMKHTLLAAKKGEIEVKPAEVAALRDAIAKTNNLLPPGLADAISAALASPGTARALGEDVRAEGRLVASRLLALEPGGETPLERITRVAAQLDAALQPLTREVGIEELREGFGGADPSLGVGASPRR